MPRTSSIESSIGALVVLFFSSACLAGVAPPFAQLMQQAEATAPLVLESRAGVAVAQGHARQAAALPNPSAGVLFENFGESRIPTNLPSPEQTTISLSEPIELPGKRSARIAAGSAEVETAEARSQLTLAEFGYILTLAYVTAEAAETRIHLYEDATAAASEDLHATQAMVDAGRQAGVHALQAEAAFLAARSEVESAHADAEEALAHLSTLVAAPELFSGVVPSLLPLVERLNTSSPDLPKAFPAVVVAETERDVALRKLDMEHARRLPDVNATLGVRRLVGDHATALVGGVSVPLPLFDQNSGNIAAASSEVTAADARLVAARAAAETGWRSGVTQANASITRLDAAKSAAAAATEAYTLTRTGFESGRTSLLDMLSARRALTEAQLRLLEAQIARIRAQAVLDRLAGRMSFGVAP